MNTAHHDRKGRPLIAVTGMGLVTSLGLGKADNWAALSAGRSGIRPITRFPTDGLRTTIAGAVDFLDLGPSSAPALSAAMALEAGREAISQARIGKRGAFPGPLYLATPPAEIEWAQRRALYDASPASEEPIYSRLLSAARASDWREMQELVQFASVADRVSKGLARAAADFHIDGLCLRRDRNPTRRRGHPARRFRRRPLHRNRQLRADRGPDPLLAVVRAVDTKQRARRSLAPLLEDRDGFVMAEGAGALVLESYEAAAARGAEILGLVLGCGEKADDYHRTRSKPDGTAIIGAIRNALTDAVVDPGDIDYVNAHGTSTPENDKMEYLSLYAVLGDHLAATPVSSNKSMIGHTLSASGAIEAVISLLTIENGLLPPTINYTNPDPEVRLDPVANAARSARVRTVLSNSFGFGGQNVSLVLGAP